MATEMRDGLTGGIEDPERIGSVVVKGGRSRRAKREHVSACRLHHVPLPTLALSLGGHLGKKERGGVAHHGCPDLEANLTREKGLLPNFRKERNQGWQGVGDGGPRRNCHLDQRVSGNQGRVGGRGMRPQSSSP